MEKTKKRDSGYDLIRVVATLLVLICHFYSTCIANKIQLFNGAKYIIGHDSAPIGAIGVILFFMLSGAVLWMTNKDVSIADFYKKRFARICIPQWIGFIGAGLLTFAFGRKISCDIIGGIISFFGLNYTALFWKQFDIKVIWLIGEWFTAVIILLYVIFPLLRHLFAKFRIVSTMLVLTIFIINLNFEILTYSNGWFSISNGLMCLWLGMFFEEYKEKLCNIKVVLPAILLSVGIWCINPKHFFGFNYLPCFFFTVPLFVLLYQIKFSNKFTQYVSTYSYEIYLVHHRIFYLLMPAFTIGKKMPGVQIFLIFLILLGIIFMVSKQLQKLSNYVFDNCKKLFEYR